MIERHITFTVRPDKTAAFEQFISDEYRPAMAASPGFVKLELLREAEHPTRYQMVFRFENAGSAAKWRTSATHAALQPALKALHEDMEVEGYEVVG